MLVGNNQVAAVCYWAILFLGNGLLNFNLSFATRALSEGVWQAEWHAHVRDDLDRLCETDCSVNGGARTRGSSCKKASL